MSEFYSFTQSLTHSLTHTLTPPSLAQLLTFFVHLLTYSLTNSLPHSFTHSIIHSLPHSFTQSLNHSNTYTPQKCTHSNCYWWLDIIMNCSHNLTLTASQSMRQYSTVSSMRIGILSYTIYLATLLVRTILNS